MTASEISKVTGIPTGTVSTLLTKMAKSASSPKPNAATSCRNSHGPATGSLASALSGAAAARRAASASPLPVRVCGA